METLLESTDRDLRIVLVGTQHPGNIGSAARAMKTMGLSRLVLVAPEKAPDRDTQAMAAGVPVAAFNAPGPRDLIPGSKAGAVNEDLATACTEALNEAEEAGR